MHTIELATRRDLPGIRDLQMKAFRGQALIYNDFKLPALTQTADDLNREFDQKTFYKATLDQRIIASIRCFVRDETLHIEKLIVDPEYQNRGIGTSIMQQVEDIYSHRAKRFQLFTGHKSVKNLHLYRKLGYREIRQEPLNDACTLIVLEKSMDGDKLGKPEKNENRF